MLSVVCCYVWLCVVRCLLLDVDACFRSCWCCKCGVLFAGLVCNRMLLRLLDVVWFVMCCLVCCSLVCVVVDHLVVAVCCLLVGAYRVMLCLWCMVSLVVVLLVEMLRVIMRVVAGL